jgi:digeranylgeranylglycerophospholipid reductase
MHDENFDVVVIGAGPAGSRTAALTARAGLSTLLLEKRKKIGFPVRCAEGIGPREDVERFLDLDDDLISSTIDGFAVVSPGGRWFEADRKGVGFIVDRERFDRRLADLAEAAGAVVRTSHQVTGLLRNDHRFRGVEVTDLESGRRYTAGALVTAGADGVESISLRWAGLKGAYRPREVMSCAQHLVEGMDTRDTKIEFHLGRRFAPGGYAWVFPKGPGSANVGVGVNPAMAGGLNAVDYLERFLESRCPGAGRGRMVVGGTVVARGLSSLAAGGFVAVGEAANQNNPFSGGGIINALEGADLAAETIIQAIGDGDVSARSLGRYTRRWKRSTGRANELFWHAAQSFYAMDDDTMEKIIAKLKDTPGLVTDTGVDPLRMLRVLVSTSPGLLFRLAASLVKR